MWRGPGTAGAGEKAVKKSSASRAARKWPRQALMYLRLLLKAVVQFHSDNGFFLSASIAFNIVINIIPFIMLLLSLLGTYLYGDEVVLKHIIHYIGNIIPGPDPGVTRMISQVIETRKVVGFLGFAGLLWISSWVFGSMRIALNTVFRVDKGRGPIRGIAIDVLMIFVVGFLLLLSMVLTSFVTFIRSDQLSLLFSVGPALQWTLKYVVPLFFTYCVFFLVYVIVPNRKIGFGSALRASVFSSILWELAKQLFGWYVAHLTRLPVIYGSLTTMVALVFWIYYSAAILLVGGEFAYLLEKIRTGEQEAKRG